MGVSKYFLCISWLFSVWYVWVHVCVKQQTDDLYVIYIIAIDSGWNF